MVDLLFIITLKFLCRANAPKISDNHARVTWSNVALLFWFMLCNDFDNEIPVSNERHQTLLLCIVFIAHQVNLGGSFFFFQPREPRAGFLFLKIFSPLFLQPRYVLLQSLSKYTIHKIQNFVTFHHQKFSFLGEKFSFDFSFDFWATYYVNFR